MCVRESPEAGKHTLEHVAESHGNECSEGRRAEEKVKGSRKEHFNHFMTTEGSRAGRRHPRSGAHAWPLFGKSQVSVPGLLRSAAASFSAQIRT